MVRVTYDAPSINAAASDTFYIPCPYIDSGLGWSIQVNGAHVLAGLVLSTAAGNGYCIVQLFNPSAGTVNLGSTQYTLKADKSGVATIDLGP